MFIPLHDANALKKIKLQFVTLGLIAINVIIWLLTASVEASDIQTANAIYYSFGFIPAVVNDAVVLPADYITIPGPASYVSYTFLHAGFMHLAGNMLFLWVFGDNVEDAMGHFRFLVFYLVCGAVGAAVHGFTFPDSQAPLVGASGAVAGLVGAYLMLHPNIKVWILVFARIPIRLTAFWVLGGWISFQIFSYFADPQSEVSWAAHVGGAIAGIILIPLFKSRDVLLFDRELAEVKPTEILKAEEAAANIDAPEKKKPSMPWGRGGGK